MTESGDNVPERRADGTFAPGRNIGRPKGAKNKAPKVVRDVMEKVANAVHDVSEGGVERTKLAAAMESLLNDAISGNTQAMALFLAYYVGRPRQQEPTEQDMDEMAERFRQRLAQSATSGWQPGAGAQQINGESNATVTPTSED